MSIASLFSGILGTPGSNSAVMAQLLSGLVAGSTPPPNLQNIDFQEYADPESYQYLGDLNIESMSPTELRNIIMDPQLQQAQMETLGQLGEAATSGMTAIDRARLAEIQSQQATEQRGARDSILSQARQRGMGGSGMELAAQFQAQQEGANRASRQGVDVAAMAQQSARDAALQRAGLAGSMEQAQFGRQAMQAQAQDAINQFNTANRNAASERNLSTRQGLSGMNTSQRNQTGQMNTDLQNQQMMHNMYQIPMARFGAQQSNAQAMGGGIGNAGQMQNQNANAQYGANTQLFGALLGAGGALGGGYLARSDRNAKTDIQEADLDIEKFLNDLTPYKYKYKEGYGEDTSRPRVGIMAQDIEKNPMGAELVNEDQKGKTVDLIEAIPKVLASLGYLNQKIEDMKS